MTSTAVVYEWSVSTVSQGWRLEEIAAGDETDPTQARYQLEAEMRRHDHDALMGVVVLCDLDADGVRMAVRTVGTAYRNEGEIEIEWEWDEAEDGEEW